MAKTYIAGTVTAYGAAVKGGYTGTYEEFCAEQAKFAENAQQVAEDRAAVDAAAEEFTGTTVPSAVQEVETAGAAQVDAVEQEGETQRGLIQEAATGAIGNVETAGAAQVDAVQAEGTTQVGNVNTAGTTQVGNVNAAGSTQVDAVQAKGTEVLNSIPSDYSELTGEVSDLKSAIDDVYKYQTETNLQPYLTTSGGIKYSDGTNNNAASSIEAYYRSDYIPVNVGDRITYFATKVSVGSAVIAFYDENKTYNQALSVVGTNTDSQTGNIIISAPGYIRLVCRNTNIQEDGNFSIISQSGWTDEALSGRIDHTESALEKTLTTDDVDWEVGSITATGANNSSTARVRSGFISAKCSSVQFSITAGYRFAAVWYNENQDIPCLRIDYWFNENITITPPDGTAYLRLIVSKVPEETANVAYADEIESVGLLSVNDISNDLRTAEQNIASAQEEVDQIQSALNYSEPTEAISLLTETGHITNAGIVNDTYDPPVYMHSDFIPFEKGGTVSYADVRVTNMCAIALYRYPREGEDSFDAENSVILLRKSSGLFEMPYNGYIRLCCRIAEINNGASFVLLNRAGSEIQNLDMRVTALENDIPLYWKTYMDSKYPVLWEKDGQIGSGGDSFVFITDLHYERNELQSPKIIKQIVSKTAVKNVFCGGDLIDHQDTAALAIEKLESWQSLFSGLRVFNIVGNHDNNNYDSSQPNAALTKGQFYGIMVKPEEQWINTGGELYYCVDNESQKIRYICLAIECFDDVGVSGTQRTWLQSKLTEKDSSWTILVIQHRIWGSSAESIATKAQNVINAINEVWANINAKFIGIVAGHTHLDYNTTESTYGYNLIVVNCDANTGRNSGYTRTAGTTTEQSFDVMYIDKTNSKLYAVRIGAGDTSVGGGTGIREFSY